MTFGLDLIGPYFETILSINFLMPYQTMYVMYVLWICLVPFVDVSIGIYVMVLDKIMDENIFFFFLLPFVDVSIMLNLDSDIFI